MNAVLNLLKEKVLPTDDKAIVVSQWKGLLDLIAIHLKSEGICFGELNGTIIVHKRMQIVDDFNNKNSRTKVSI